MLTSFDDNQGTEYLPWEECDPNDFLCDDLLLPGDTVSVTWYQPMPGLKSMKNWRLEPGQEMLAACVDPFGDFVNQPLVSIMKGNSLSLNLTIISLNCLIIPLTRPF